jgi:hypothetical protein
VRRFGERRLVKPRKRARGAQLARRDQLAVLLIKQDI